MQPFVDQTDPITRLLLEGIQAKVFPGAVLFVRHQGQVRFHQAVGRTSGLPDSHPVHPQTIYDLASLTKPLATASVILLLVQDGLLDLETPIDSVLQETKGLPLGPVVLKDVLCHQSGLPWWRPLYQSFPPSLPSEASFRQERVNAFLDLILKEPLEAVSPPKSVYSDLGYIVLGFMVERITNQLLADVCQSRIFGPLQARPLGYRGQHIHEEMGAPIGECAPTEQDPWRGRLLQGEVHDDNAFALGGIAGHAGLFGTAEAVGQVTKAWLEGYQGKPGLFDGQLVKQFVTAQPGTSWALGWDTPSQPSSSGKWFSPESFGHLGFTGTSIWIDPIRELEVIFLSNRVYPTRDNQAIKAFRPKLHDVIIQELES
ncbi:MAG: beta-lactamase family protein [Nitrospirota bacterium]|nr:beta-lactamase family protein [Nitrospirota bacterium]